MFETGIYTAVTRCNPDIPCLISIITLSPNLITGD